MDTRIGLGGRPWSRARLKTPGSSANNLFSGSLIVARPFTQFMLATNEKTSIRPKQVSDLFLRGPTEADREVAARR